MQKLVLLLFLSAFFVVCYSAPTQQQAIVDELLAEKANNLATQEESDVATMTENERTSVRELLGGLLNIGNDYAQKRFRNREPFRRIADLINNFAQERLQPTPTAIQRISDYFRLPKEKENLQQETMAEIEQDRTFRELLGTLLDTVNDFTQKRLQRTPSVAAQRRVWNFRADPNPELLNTVSRRLQESNGGEQREVIEQRADPLEKEYLDSLVNLFQDLAE